MKKEINEIIKKTFAEEIAAKGLAGKLEVYACENTFQRRPKYWKKDTCCYFKVFLWELNILDEHEQRIEINNRIMQAINYFGL